MSDVSQLLVSSPSLRSAGHVSPISGEVGCTPVFRLLLVVVVKVVARPAQLLLLQLLGENYKAIQSPLEMHRIIDPLIGCRMPLCGEEA